MENMLDIYTFRSQLWENQRNQTSLKNKANSLFNWLERQISDETIAKKIGFFKEEYISLNESAEALYKVEDELIDKIDEIIEKMIYAVYAELQKLQQSYAPPQQQSPPYGVHDYELPYYYPTHNKRRRKSWLDKIFDSVRPYGDLLKEETENAHPVIKIIQLLSKFGSDAKKLVRQSVRSLNQQMGIAPSPAARTDNGLGSFSLNTNDMAKAFSYPQQNIQQPTKNPINDLDDLAPPSAASKPTPNINPSSSAGATKSILGNIRDPRKQVVNTNEPTNTIVSTPNIPLTPNQPIQQASPEVAMPENDVALRMAEKLKQEKDPNKFVQELLNFRRPVARMAKILRLVTGQEISKKNNVDSLLDIARKWHKAHHGLAGFNPAKKEPVSPPVAKAPELSPVAKAPEAPKVSIPTKLTKPKDSQELEKQLEKLSAFKPSISFISAMRKLTELIPGFDLDDYEPSTLSKAYSKALGDTQTETQENLLKLVKNGGLAKKVPEEPEAPEMLAPTPPKPEPKEEPKAPPKEDDKPSIDDLFGSSEEPSASEPEPSTNVISPEIEPAEDDYEGMGRNFGHKSKDIGNTAALSPEDLARKERARQRIEKIRAKQKLQHPNEWATMSIQEKVQYYKNLLKS